MEYKTFEQDFIVRTLEVIDQYDERVKPFVPEPSQYEVTLLINCLLGLLVMPKEKWIEAIDQVPVELLEGWGLSEGFVKDWGTSDRCKRSHEKGTLRDVVRGMRNSIAHFNVTPLGGGQRVTEVEFKDWSGFRVVIPCENLRVFVMKLAQTVASKAIKQAMKGQRGAKQEPRLAAST